MFPTPYICGLHPVRHGKREDYPLLNAKVHYDLCDVQMLASLIQTYTSNASVKAEIRYVFPLPPDSSVCSFKAVIDGKRTIKGVVKEKAKAKADYEQAVAQGKTAALLEQENIEIFEVSLGNIHPKQTIEVYISFVSIISHDGSLNSLRLNFPTAIAPRYGSPPTGPGLLGHNGSSTRQFSSAVDFSVAVEMTSHIKSITSPSHPIAMKLGESTLEASSEFNPFKARVSLSSPTLLDKDIVIVLSCQGLDNPRCMVESFSPEEGGQEYTDAYALTLVPRFELPALPTQEYIFLVDRSGSMRGGKMDAVRSALQIMLVSMPARGTFFNIISFGSRHASLWPSSVTYSADNVKAASAHVDTMSADLGGTEIRAAIEAAFTSRANRPAGGTTPTSVFVLTDGQANDLDGVTSMIKQAVAKYEANNTLLRVFCMGIGDAVSKAMCDGIARAGHGTATFVGEEEKPDQKLIGLLRAARGAVVKDISIDWGVDPTEFDTDFEMVSPTDATPEPPKEEAPLSLFDESSTRLSEETLLGPQSNSVDLPPPPKVQQAPMPNSLPPLYPGFRTSLFAIVRRGKGSDTSPSKSVRVTGSVLGRPVVLEVPVAATSNPTATGDAAAQTKMLHVIAARALIQDVEDRAKTGTLLSDVDKAAVVRLGERYGLASSQTSFVAIDKEGDPVGGVADSPFMMARSSQPQPQIRAKSRFLGLFGAPPPSSTAQAFGQAPVQQSKTKPILGGPLVLRGGAVSSAPAFTTLGSEVRPPQLDAFAAPAGGAAMFTPSFTFKSGAFGGGGPPPAPPQPRQSFVDSTVDGQPQPSPPPPGAGSLPTSSQEKGSIKKRLTGFKQQKRDSLPSSSSDPEGSGPLSPTIESFARSQSFDGSFAGSTELFQLLVKQPQAPAMPAVLGAADATKETLWCTLLCISYLERKFEAEKDVWAMIVEKAMAWVEDTLRDITGSADIGALEQRLKEEARQYVT